MLNLIMPMGGAGLRFVNEGYVVPKPLLEIHGCPFFYWSVMSVKRYIAIKSLVFVVLEEHIQKFNIDHVIHDYFPEAEIISIPEVLPGPVWTCLEGVKCIDDDVPVMFNDCDHMFRSDEVIMSLKDGYDFDGGLLTFESHNPAFSYVRYDEEGRVTGTIEKQAVSSRAICGAYLFRNSNIFRELAGEYIRTCPCSECYMSGIYNIMCERGMSVRIFGTDWHIDFGTPEGYERAKDSPAFEENDALL